MNHNFSRILFLLLSSIIYINVSADIRPEFYGGNAALKRYIAAAQQYPEYADDLPKKGVDTVTATFWVERSGNITDVSITGTKVKSVMLESKRLVENMPKWRPSDVGGVKTRGKASLQIIYRYGLSAKEREAYRPKDYVFRDTMLDDYQRFLNNKGKWVFLYKNGSDILPYNYEHLYHYPDGTVRACHNGKWGLLNCNNEEILPYEFDELYYYEDGYCRVRKGDKWGLYSSTGKIIAACRYDTLGLFGLDKSFGECFNEEYQPGKIVMRDLALVMLNGKAGFINRSGREEIACYYDSMLPFSTGFAVFQQKGKMGLYNDLGKVLVSARYDSMRYYRSNLAIVCNGQFYGIADQLGQSVLPCVFDTVSPFTNSSDIVLAKKKGKYGLYNLEGLPLIDCRYDSIKSNPNARNSILLFLKGEPETRSLLFETGIKNVANLESKLERFEKGGYWGFRLKGDSKAYITPIYDYVDNFYHGYALVSIGGKWGMVNKYGREVIPVRYDYLNPFTSGLARFSKNGMMGFVNEEGEEAIAPKFVHVYPFIDGIAVVNKQKYMDTKGKPVAKKVDGVIRQNGSPCTYFPNLIKEAFPDYELPFLYPTDVCE